MGAGVLRVRPAAVLLAVITASCAAGDAAWPPTAAPPPDAGRWTLAPRTDAVSGATITTAYIEANRLNALGGLQSASLQLGCFRGQPVVRIAFNQKIGTNRSATLAWRFDDRPGREAKVRFLSDNKTVIIEDPAEVAAFAGALAVSDKLELTIVSLIFGRSVLRAPVGGGAVALAQAYATCPLPQPGKPPSTRVS